MLFYQIKEDFLCIKIVILEKGVSKMQCKKLKVGVTMLVLLGSFIGSDVSVYPVQAYQESDSSVSFLLNNWLYGDWYDQNGNLVLTIGNGYINGCQVITGFDFIGGIPGEGTIRILESTGYRDIHMQWSGNGKHRTLVIDNNMTLNRR
jgi:hypothetical protein